MLCKSEGSASVVVYLLTANVGCRNGHIRPLFQPTEQISRSISSQNLGPTYSNAELSAEAHLLIAAGSDITSTTLSGLFFYLTPLPESLQETHHGNPKHLRILDSIRAGTTLSSCQYLRARIDESLRMSPAGASEQLREVLPGGFEVSGNYLPAGTLVGTAGWAIMHHEDAFPDPFVFRPERWIVDEKNGVTADEVDRAKLALNPFSAGTDNCVGQKLAMLELLITVGRVLYRMDVRALPGNRTGEERLI